MKKRDNQLPNPAGRTRTAKRASKESPVTPPAQEQAAGRSAAEAPARPQPKAPPPPPPPAPAPPPPSAPPTPEAAAVAFSLFEPHAKQVCLCGQFNNWSPKANPMARRGDGHWLATLALKPGRYEYKFLVDGQWMADPEAKQSVYNIHGTLNSVVEVVRK